MAGHDGVLDRRAVLEREDPTRPGIACELAKPRRTIGMNDTGVVTLGRERELTVVVLEPGIEAVDEHHAARRRRSRSQEQGVIAPCADACRRP